LAPRAACGALRQPRQAAQTGGCLRGRPADLHGWFYLIFQSLIPDLASAFGLIGLGIALIQRFAYRHLVTAENGLVIFGEVEEHIQRLVGLAKARQLSCHPGPKGWVLPRLVNTPRFFLGEIGRTYFRWPKVDRYRSV
jgi:hypothetical protein